MSKQYWPTFPLIHLLLVSVCATGHAARHVFPLDARPAVEVQFKARDVGMPIFIRPIIYQVITVQTLKKSVPNTDCEKDLVQVYLAITLLVLYRPLLLSTYVLPFLFPECFIFTCCSVII